MQKIRFILFALFALNPLFCISGIKEDIAKSIVRVRSGNKHSTGFFWKNGKTVLTTLHSLSNSSDLEVYIHSIGKWKKAKIQKVYKNADIIQLDISEYNSMNYISEKYSSRPVIDTKAFTVGYNSGSPSYIDRDFSVGLLQGNTLDNILPPSSKNEIKTLGFPNLSTEIIYLKGSLLHGFSGAPIVDYQGKLIGIADGGLENGAAGISWCISAIYVNLLENSSENVPYLNQNSLNNLFASEEYQEDTFDDEILEVNEFQFKKIKTRSFAQLDMTGKYSSMDSMGLIQLLNNFSNFNYNAFEYDVYLEMNTGATIVVPSKYPLQQENDLLVIETPAIKYYISISNTNNIQQSSEIFEYTIMPLYFTNWSIDFQWTYPVPYEGLNGSFIRRRAYFGNGGQNYLFEALAGNNDCFLGVAALRNNIGIGPTDFENWAQFAIAVQLSAFTN